MGGELDTLGLGIAEHVLSERLHVKLALADAGYEPRFAERTVSRCAPEQDDRQQADRRKRKVGEGIAPEVRKEASHGGSDSVAGGPSEVRDREGHGPFHPGLLGAAREE